MKLRQVDKHLRGCLCVWSKLKFKRHAVDSASFDWLCDTVIWWNDRTGSATPPGDDFSFAVIHNAAFFDREYPGAKLKLCPGPCEVCGKRSSDDCPHKIHWCDDSYLTRGCVSRRDH